VRLSIKMKYRKNVPAKLVGTILLLSCLLTIQGCGDRYDQVDCDNQSWTVMHPSGEFCMCAEDYGWMYDYEQEKWRCVSVPGFKDSDNSYSYVWIFNGSHMGPTNSHHILKFIFNKPDSSFRIAAKESVASWSTERVVYKRNSTSGDSIYMYDLLVRTDPSNFIYEGERCLVTGRGRVSTNKDTLHMTAYIIPWDDYALVASANGVYRDNRDIDVSKAVDVRKMQFLSARAFPKYAQ